MEHPTTTTVHLDDDTVALLDDLFVSVAPGAEIQLEAEGEHVGFVLPSADQLDASAAPFLIVAVLMAVYDEAKLRHAAEATDDATRARIDAILGFLVEETDEEIVISGMARIVDAGVLICWPGVTGGQRVAEDDR